MGRDTPSDDDAPANKYEIPADDFEEAVETLQDAGIEPTEDRIYETARLRGLPGTMYSRPDGDIARTIKQDPDTEKLVDIVVGYRPDTGIADPQVQVYDSVFGLMFRYEDGGTLDYEWADDRDDAAWMCTSALDSALEWFEENKPDSAELTVRADTLGVSETYD